MPSFDQGNEAAGVKAAIDCLFHLTIDRDERSTFCKQKDRSLRQLLQVESIHL